MNEKVGIHEFIDIVGHNRAKYMHHMTANWVPLARKERNQLCFGVWGTVGSTGRWPEVVNMWELDGWDGLTGNLRHELSHGSLQDPSLAEWWALAASLRRGGVDRIVVPEPWTRSIEQLVADGVRGVLYSHELVTLPPGAAPDFLAAFAAEGVPAHETLGLELVGAFRVAMVNDSEAIVIWAVPDWPTWARVERAWLGVGTADGEGLRAWRRTTLALGADWRRTLMVDAPLAPLRIGRQPEASDRRPLDEI
ncbi:MAG: NIPSNAP family containing protein [Acidimicrobiales bacterium]